MTSFWGLIPPLADTTAGNKQPQWGYQGCPGGAAGVYKAYLMSPSGFDLPKLCRVEGLTEWSTPSACRACTQQVEKGRVGLEGQMEDAGHTMEAPS